MPQSNADTGALAIVYLIFFGALVFIVICIPIIANRLGYVIEELKKLNALMEISNKIAMGEKAGQSVAPTTVAVEPSSPAPATKPTPAPAPPPSSGLMTAEEWKAQQAKKGP